MTLLYYESVFSGLNLHMAGARVSPHKVAMLLAVMDLVEDGTLTDNRIEYSKSLTAAFQERFRELGTEGDSSRAIYPYFHLRKDGFWHHWLKPGQSESYYQLSTVTNRNQIDRHIAFAYLAGRKRDMEYISTVHDVDPPPYTGNWDRVLDPDLPEHVAMALPPKRRYLARHVNYSQREAENRQLGESGERFVVDFEQFHLARAGREDLAHEVEWSSREPA